VITVGLPGEEWSLGPAERSGTADQQAQRPVRLMFPALTRLRRVSAGSYAMAGQFLPAALL